jgi:hypothetical protein
LTEVEVVGFFDAPAGPEPDGQNAEEVDKQDYIVDKSDCKLPSAREKASEKKLEMQKNPGQRQKYFVIQRICFYLGIAGSKVNIKYFQELLDKRAFFVKVLFNKREEM